MSLAKVLGLIGGAYAVNEMTKSGDSRSANMNDTSANAGVVDLLVQRIKTDAHLQSILRGPAGAAGAGGEQVAAELEILSCRVDANLSESWDHYLFVLLGEMAGGATDGSDVLLKIDLSTCPLKDSFNEITPLTSGNTAIDLYSNVDGTEYSGSPGGNQAPFSPGEWEFVDRNEDIVTFKLGGIFMRDRIGAFERTAFAAHLHYSGEGSADEAYSIGIEVSGGGLSEPVTGEIVVQPALYA